MSKYNETNISKAIIYATPCKAESHWYKLWRLCRSGLPVIHCSSIRNAQRDDTQMQHDSFLLPARILHPLYRSNKAISSWIEYPSPVRTDVEHSPYRQWTQCTGHANF